MHRLLLLPALLLIAADEAPTTAPSSAPAQPPVVARAEQVYERLTKSLVVVQYTYDGEAGRREFAGLGVIIDPKGTVVTSMLLFPLYFPDEQLKDFKIVLPGDEEIELDATFVGRDERSEVAFVRTKKPQSWQAITFDDQPVKVGQKIMSVGLLPKEAGYKSYYNEAQVSALLRGPVPHVLVTSPGLAAVGSPVVTEDGKAIGLVAPNGNSGILLSGDKATAQQFVASPPRFFVPASYFLLSLRDMPVEGKEQQIPWLGTPLSGLKKDVAEHFNLKGQPVVMVGDVIADSPAAKGGLKPGDKIVKVNGQALERGDEPDEAWMILMRKIRRMKVGETIKFTVLRDADKPMVEVPVKLELQPRQAHQVKRWYAEDMGFSVREVVFGDTYTKKLPASQKGVVVAFVRPGGSASSAKLAPGDLVTKLNGAAVTNLEQFKQAYSDFRKNSPREAVVLEVVRERSTEVIRIEPPQ